MSFRQGSNIFLADQDERQLSHCFFADQKQFPVDRSSAVILSPEHRKKITHFLNIFEKFPVVRSLLFVVFECL